MSVPYEELPSEEEGCLFKATRDHISRTLAAHAGICFRRSKDYDDSIKTDIFKWGHKVKGVQEDEDWIRVTDKKGEIKYLPIRCQAPESGSPVVIEQVFSRGSRFPGEAAVAILVWFGAWASILHFIDNWIANSPIDRIINIAPYVLCCSIAVQVRFIPPVGWMLPLPEGLLAYLQACSLYVACISLLVAILMVIKYVHLKHTDFDHNASIWFAASIFFAVAAFLKNRASKKITLAITPLGCLSNELPLPPRPFAARIHGYLYAMFSDLEGAPVFMQQELGVADNHRRVCLSRPVPQGNWHIDVWVEEGKKKAGRPIYFYIHGGYWKSGGVRMTQHVHMMQILASRGWFVVSVQYRKRPWPVQLEDCEDALKWVCGKKAAAMGADRTKIVVGGSGAGGQLAAMLCVKAHRDFRIPILGNVLFYPNLDPGDSAKQTLRCGSCSIVHTFFTECVLGGNNAKWNGEDSPNFLGDVNQVEDVLVSFPPVFLVHGSNDSVVPVETSRLFIAKLAKAKGLYTGTRPGDFYLELPGARHSFDIFGSDDSMRLFGAAATWCKKQVGAQPTTYVQAPVKTMAPTITTTLAPTVPTATVFQNIPNYAKMPAIQAVPKKVEVPVAIYQAKILDVSQVQNMPMQTLVGFTDKHVARPVPTPAPTPVLQYVNTQVQMPRPIVQATTRADSLPVSVPNVRPAQQVETIRPAVVEGPLVVPTPRNTPDLKGGWLNASLPGSSSVPIGAASSVTRPADPTSGFMDDVKLIVGAASSVTRPADPTPALVEDVKREGLIAGAASSASRPADPTPGLVEDVKKEGLIGGLGHWVMDHLPEHHADAAPQAMEPIASATDTADTDAEDETYAAFSYVAPLEAQDAQDVAESATVVATEPAVLAETPVLVREETAEGIPVVQQAETSVLVRQEIAQEIPVVQQAETSVLVKEEIVDQMPVVQQGEAPILVTEEIVETIPVVQQAAKVTEELLIAAPAVVQQEILPASQEVTP